MKTRNIDNNAKYLIELLNRAGYEAYLVGGCVRDLMLDKSPKDWDICTSAKPQQIIDLLNHNNIKLHKVGAEFGTITAMFNQRVIRSTSSGGAIILDETFEYEITTYRADAEYSDGRHPDKVNFVSKIEDDLCRRDFTINAMAYNPLTNELIDLFGGQEDLHLGVIRTVGDANDRFTEDSLRIVRALRFAIRYGFTISYDTNKAMRKHIALLNRVSKERITQELEKILTCGKSIRPYFLTYDFIIAEIIPEIKTCFKFNQNNKYHTHDVYEHMLCVVDYCNTNKFEIKLAALLHDIGKPNAYTEDEQGQGHFYGHPDISHEICSEMIDRNFRLTNEQKDRVLELIKYHDMMIAYTKRSVKRALNKHGEDFLKDWFILKQADMDDHIYPSKNHKYVIDIEYINNTMNDILLANECFTIKNLDINGHDIMKLTNGKSGKHIGLILNTLLEKVMDEELVNDAGVLKEEASKIWEEISR